MYKHVQTGTNMCKHVKTCTCFQKFLKIYKHVQYRFKYEIIMYQYYALLGFFPFSKRVPFIVFLQNHDL